MGEGWPRPESGGEAPRIREVEGTVEKQRTPELIVTISETELEESKLSFAKGRSFEKFEDMPPIERAEFWAIENGVPDNYLETEKAAKEAGLDRKGQLGYKIRALEGRVGALSRSLDKGDIKEFHSLDKVGTSLRQELAELK